VKNGRVPRNRPVLAGLLVSRRSLPPPTLENSLNCNKRLGEFVSYFLIYFDSPPVTQEELLPAGNTRGLSAVSDFRFLRAAHDNVRE